LIAVAALYYSTRKESKSVEIKNGLNWLLMLVAFQILLGVLTILSYVNIVVALLHQANAILLFGLAIYCIHRLRALDERNS
jgi:heme A synthase